jgi:hypothetical protein
MTTDPRAVNQITEAIKCALSDLDRVSARWTDQQLIITTKSLGAVRTGMTLEQAQAAADVKFDATGVGASYPSTLRTESSVSPQDDRGSSVVEENPTYACLVVPRGPDSHPGHGEDDGGPDEVAGRGEQRLIYVRPQLLGRMSR